MTPAEMLMRWGVHDYKDKSKGILCAKWTVHQIDGSYIRDDKRCTCGLDAAIKQLEDNRNDRLERAAGSQRR